MAFTNQNIDLKAVAASGVTAVAIGMGVFGTETKVALKDSINHMGANALGQFTNLSNVLPIPGVLGAIGQDIGAGVAYWAINKVHDTSPFRNNLSQVLYGIGTSVLSYNITEKIISDL